MSDLVGGTVCNGCGESCGHAPGIGYFCQNDACTYEQSKAKAMLRHMLPVDPRDARITELETALAEARNAALEEAAKVADDAYAEHEQSGLTHPEDSDSRSRCFARARSAMYIAQAIRDMKAASDPLLDRQE